MKGTDIEYKKIISKCRKLFEEKMSDYGPSWRILRLSSLTDQIFIKAQRIRNIQVLSERKVDEGQEPEFIGIVNYSLIALIQIKLGLTEKPDLKPTEPEVTETLKEDSVQQLRDNLEETDLKTTPVSYQPEQQQSHL